MPIPAALLQNNTMGRAARRRAAVTAQVERRCIETDTSVAQARDALRHHQVGKCRWNDENNEHTFPEINR